MSLVSCLSSTSYVEFSPNWQSHQLFRRSLIICDSTGIFVTGDTTSLVADTVLSSPGDTFLEAFSAPASGFLCTLSVQLKVPTSNVIASLSIYNDSISSTAIVGGTASSIGAASST